MLLCLAVLRAWVPSWMVSNSRTLGARGSTIGVGWGLDDGDLRASLPKSLSGFAHQFTGPLLYYSLKLLAPWPNLSRYRCLLALRRDDEASWSFCNDRHIRGLKNGAAAL